MIGDKVLELAHKVDEGIDYEIVTKSLREDNQRLRDKIEICSGQLSLSFDLSSSDDDLIEEALRKFVKGGTQSNKHQEAKKAIKYVVKKIRNSN